MPYYRIPLYERSTFLNGAQIWGREKTMCVDGVGFLVRYLPEQESLMTPEYMRHFLMCRRKTHCIVRARTPEQAIDKFYAQWEAAKVGDDKSPEHKALWIATNNGEYIEELPKCDRLTAGENKSGQFFARCGGLGRGYRNPGCVLDGYDPPDDCPIRNYWDTLWKLKEAKTLPISKVKNFDIVKAVEVMVGSNLQSE